MTRTSHPKEWEVRFDQFDGEADNTLMQALLELVTIVNRVGGGGVFAAIREELEPGVWLTTGIRFRWESFVPGRRYEAPEPEPVGNPEADPVAA